MSNIEYFDTERVAMKVALLGATGFVGSALLKEALDRGHVVTAIARHPEKLEKREERRLATFTTRLLLRR
jgi:uncharacterized protein YbjT (DUF2867 family)